MSLRLCDVENKAELGPRDRDEVRLLPGVRDRPRSRLSDRERDRLLDRAAAHTAQSRDARWRRSR